MNKVLQQPLSNVQLELLRLYSTNVSDSTLLELKKSMALFFMNKLREEADKVWDEKKLTDEQLSNKD